MSPTRPGRRRRLLVGLALSGVVAGAAGSAGSALWLTRSWPREAGDPPKDLACMAVSIPWSGGQLQAWSVAGEGRGAVLLLHGWRGSRHGMLGRAQVLVDAGYSVLVPDLPAHGESTGDLVTFGRDEGAAVDALLGHLQATRPGQPLGVVAQSLGAVSFLTSSHEIPVEAVVVESAFATLDEALEHRMSRYLGGVGTLLTPVLRWEVGWLRGLDADQSRPVDQVRGVRGALLVAHGELDQSTPVSHAEALFAAAGLRPGSPYRDLWIVPGADHEDLRKLDAEAYDRRVLSFLREHLTGAH